MVTALASSAAPGGVGEAAAPEGGGSHDAQTPGGERQVTNPIVNAGLQRQQVMCPPGGTLHQPYGWQVAIDWAYWC